MITSKRYLNKLEELQELNYSDYNVSIEEEPVFPVDLNERFINVPSDFEVLAVVGDHKAETVWFILNRYFDGIDLSSADKTWGVQFTNAKGEDMLLGIKKYVGNEVPKINGLPNIDENDLILGWEITKDVTKKAGKVTFSLRCFQLDANNEVSYNLSTEPATVTIAVGQTITAENESVNPDADTLTELVGKIDKIMGNDGTISVVDYDNITESTKPTINEVVLNKGLTSDRLNIPYEHLINKPTINGVELSTSNFSIGGVELVEDALTVVYPSYKVNGKPLIDGADIIIPTEIPVDNELLADSINPVQNKVIYEEIEQIWAELNEMTYIPLTINSFESDPALVEVGNTVSEVSFAWELSKAPLALSINDTPVNALISGNTILTGLNLTDTTTFTLAATDKGGVITKDIKVEFANKIFYGVSASDTFNTDMFNALTSVLKTTKDGTYELNVGDGEYAYFAAPVSYGACNINVSGFDGGFEAAVEFNYNDIEYHVYRSTNPGLENIKLVVS